MAWNRHSDPDSTGALAFYSFKKASGGDSGPPPPSLRQALTDEQILKALRGELGLAPVCFLPQSRCPFGRYFRVGRCGGDHTWPVGGGSLRRRRHGHAPGDQLHALPATAKEQVGHTGQSSTQVVILSDPPESYAIIPLGESDHKESGHWDDQAEKALQPRARPSEPTSCGPTSP